MTTEEQLQQLTNAVNRLSNNQIAPIAPIAPLAPVNTGNDIITTLVNSVHNLDQKFSEKFADLKLSINDLKTNASNEVNATKSDLVSHITEDNKMHNEHSDKIRIIELEVSVVKTKLVVWGTAGILFLGIAQFIISKFL